MRRILLALGLLAAPMATARAETVRLYAAGNLKAVMADITVAFGASTGGAHKVETILGASGLLRERIEKGAAAHVFASADTGHPKRLAEQGRTVSPPVIFARNQLCALAREGLAVTSTTLVDVMLDAKVRLGTSTPKADPSGDYAFALFGKAEAVKAGARGRLRQRRWSPAKTPKAPASTAASRCGWRIEDGTEIIAAADHPAATKSRRRSIRSSRVSMRSILFDSQA